MRKFLLAALFLLPFTMNAQSYTTETDTVTGQPMLKGACTFRNLTTNPAFAWMQAANAYAPKADAIAVLKRDLPAHKIVVLFGSWCEDSQLQLPKLYTILQDAAIPEANITLYALDRTKHGAGAEADAFKATRVPTIVVLDGDRELGRIVETPRKTLEEDLAAIVSGR